MSSIDVEGKYLAVAGSNGFTHYSFLTRKWKIFGNADQEKDIRVTGGILWWKEFICMSCFNLGENKNEVKFFFFILNLNKIFFFIKKKDSLLFTQFKFG